MTSYKSFSLSLQKQIQHRKGLLDSELNRTFKELKIQTLLKQSAIIKGKGFSTVSLLFMIVLLPFINRGLTGISVLGYQFLQLGYHNGVNFFPH
jgi:hypothetical protein